mmetsp:Transcript_7574/g.21087  ORF Transcript_7574/g.21087 Transcript_7574/m.21087 type:complete len:174 (+) Transcript_7574:995-1516(+)
MTAAANALHRKAVFKSPMRVQRIDAVSKSKQQACRGWRYGLMETLKSTITSPEYLPWNFVVAKVWAIVANLVDRSLIPIVQRRPEYDANAKDDSLVNVCSDGASISCIIRRIAIVMRSGLETYALLQSDNKKSIVKIFLVSVEMGLEATSSTQIDESIASVFWSSDCISFWLT